MQHSFKLARAISLATWLAIVQTVISVTVEAHADRPVVALDATAAYAWAGLAALSNASFQLMASRRVSRRLTNSQQRSMYLVMATLSLVANTGILASTGGVTGAYWLPFIPLVLFTGLAAPRWWALGTGLLAAVAVTGATWWSVGLHQGSVGELLLVAPLFPVLGYTTAVLSASVLRIGRRAVRERDALAEHVQALAEVLHAASEGNLSIAVPRPRQESDALEKLSDSFDLTLADLRRLVGSIRGGGEAINTSATQLLATAEEHAASATQQSSAVAETTSTIEELAATAAQIAETAELVSRYAADTLHYAEQGGEAVALSVDAMDKIAQQVTVMASRALTLGERTTEIGRIVEVIEDLADQTNLLALNAAIEAARAGEHGRGFGVVAAEVRKLAERARRSTGQIRDIVREVQAETSATILASENGDREARQGASLARAAADSLARISAMVDETTVAAKEISIATQQQRSASEQVVAAMTQVSDVSRHYAVGSQQTAASAAELTTVAHELRDAISAFTVA